MYNIAHTSNGDCNHHKLSDHSNSVANICRSIGSKINISEIAYAAGILHDAGKGSFEFYQKVTTSPTDVVHHSYHGANISRNLIGSGVGDVIGMVCAGHHTGLSNYSEFDESMNKNEVNGSSFDYHRFYDEYHKMVGSKQSTYGGSRAFVTNALYEVTGAIDLDVKGSLVSDEDVALLLDALVNAHLADNANARPLGSVQVIGGAVYLLKNKYCNPSFLSNLVTADQDPDDAFKSVIRIETVDGLDKVADVLEYQTVNQPVGTWSMH